MSNSTPGMAHKCNISLSIEIQILEIQWSMFNTDTSVGEYLKIDALSYQYGQDGCKTHHIEKYEKHTYPEVLAQGKQNVQVLLIGILVEWQLALSYAVSTIIRL